MWGRFGATIVAACLAAGLLAGESSALEAWIFVRVTPGGPAPKVVHAVAGVNPVAWYGAAAHGRRVVFADGSCRTTVAAPTGLRRGCVFKTPGRHVYRIDGLAGTGVVIVRAARPNEGPW